MAVGTDCHVPIASGLAMTRGGFPPLFYSLPPGERIGEVPVSIRHQIAFAIEPDRESASVMRLACACFSSLNLVWNPSLVMTSVVIIRASSPSSNSTPCVCPRP